MEQEIDYKHEVIDSVDKEYKAYEAELLKGTPEKHATSANNAAQTPKA